MKRLVVILAAAAGFAAASPAAANVLVVRSSGPSAKSYPPGYSFPDAAQVSLRPGDVMIVLGGQATRTLRGPGTFPVSAGATKLAMASGARRGRFSAMRAGEVPPAPSVWHLDVSQSGTFCVPDGGKVQLWRADASEKVSLTLAPATGAARTVEWPAGKDVLDWPKELPVAGDAAYEVRSSGSADTAKLVFASVGAAPKDEQGLAEALIAKGCRNQLDTLLETVPDEGSAGTH
ncbi:MAG TPA: hypothetical protein VIA98_00615 [Allosphingosinicella sp.]|jgi:hypothetical protein